MRNLILVLIAFLAVATFFRAYDSAEEISELPQQASVEIRLGN